MPQEAYNAFLEGYKAGTQTIVDLVASQGSLANARAQYIQTNIQWINAISSLAHATGTWSVGNQQIQLSPLYQEFNKVSR